MKTVRRLFDRLLANSGRRNQLAKASLSRNRRLLFEQVEDRRLLTGVDYVIFGGVGDGAGEMLCHFPLSWPLAGIKAVEEVPSP